MSTVATSFEGDLLALAPFHLIASPYRKSVLVAVRRWIHDSGFKWAADRCKAVGQFLLNRRASETSEANPPAWVSRSYLSYAERVTREGSDAKFFQLLQVWRVFSRYGDHARLSGEDIRKFEHACLDGPRWAVPLVGKWVAHWHPRCETGLLSRGEGQRLLPEVRLPRSTPVRSPLALRSYLSGTRSREWAEMRYDFHTMYQCCDNWGMVMEDMPFALRQLPLLGFDLSEIITQDSDLGFGQIGMVRERVQTDGKVRFFYAPPSWMQFLLEPWARSLYKALRFIPQDCTFDQERGVARVSGWLQGGARIHSIDLSSATDRFPLAFTREALMSVSLTPNNRMWVDTFCFLSRVPVGVGFGLSEDIVNEHLPAVLEEGVLRWRVGQPLGTVPSFAAFALSHHMLVRKAFRESGYDGPVGSMPYVILGDDLVIADDCAASVYRGLIDALGVDISEAKSISGRLGEFAGRMISSGSWSFKLKWPVSLGPRTLLSYISLLGPRAVRAMNQTRLRDVIALIPTTATPLGINPGGFPRSKVEAFLAEYFFLERDTDVLGELWVDPNEWVVTRMATIHSFTYSSSPSAHCWSVPPIGGATIGYGGAPVDGPRKGSNTWAWSPYLSRAWVQRVKRAARAAHLM